MKYHLGTIIFVIAICFLLLDFARLPEVQSAPAAQQGGEAVLPTNGNPPAFEPVNCWFAVPDEAVVSCGYVSVPETRPQPASGGKMLRLAVAVFYSTATMPAPDPVVYQVGGPGGHMLAIVPSIYDKVIAPFLEKRDLVLFDPRGTGFSQPSLECFENEEPRECLRRLSIEGHNLYAYSSRSMAEDLQDIRTALGYEQWNLLGESYGTHVAQVTMREARDGLRSVVLDSVVPVVLPVLPASRTSFEAAFLRLVEHCEADPACNRAYPDLPGKLQQAAWRLNASPVTLETSCYGTDKRVSLTGDQLSAMLFESLYETELIPSIPSALAKAAEGSDYSFWEQVVCWEAVIDMLLTEGAHWSVQCSDGRLGHVCEDWPVVVENSPVMSDVPVLVLSGEFDPVTPVEYGHSVARTLLTSYVFDFPGMGHWVYGSGDPCQAEIIQSFLDDPAQQPDAACFAGMGEPEFIIEP